MKSFGTLAGTLNKHVRQQQATGTPHEKRRTTDVWIFRRRHHGWVWQRISDEADRLVESRTAFLRLDDCIRDATAHGYGDVPHLAASREALLSGKS